ncbi:MAG: hypothetical protein ACO3EJ_08810 [Ilumatobacteraceae bacterium]|jgi:hypothetical protein|nr:hypothetical protein LBMAG06_11560 [Actinomycetes bacterium]GDX19077.1 hypothetical protein LBMAG06_12060 [Actinomycetes bacterium]
MNSLFGASLLEVHTSWSWIMIIGNGLAGLWALVAHKNIALRSRALWWFTGIAQVSVFVQVVLGVAVVNRDKIEYPAFHAFYGFVAIIAIAIIYSYRAQLKSKMYLLYGFGGLFIMGLGIRAMLVGQAG